MASFRILGEKKKEKRKKERKKREEDPRKRKKRRKRKKLNSGGRWHYVYRGKGYCLHVVPRAAAFMLTCSPRIMDDDVIGISRLVRNPLVIVLVVRLDLGLRCRRRRHHHRHRRHLLEPHCLSR